MPIAFLVIHGGLFLFSVESKILAIRLTVALTPLKCAISLAFAVGFYLQLPQNWVSRSACVILPLMLNSGSSRYTLVRTVSIWLAIIGMSAAITCGQAPASTPQMPGDPKEVLIPASQSNGLVGPGIQPWHLKAKFQLQGVNGNPPDQGTIEEFWAGPHKIRVSFTSNNFAQTTYWTDSGVLQSGPAKLPSYLMDELRTALVEPMPSPDFLKTQAFESKERDLGGVKLTCLTAKIVPPRNVETSQRTIGPTFCLDTDKPALRLKVSGMGQRQMLGNKIAIFQGRFVPQELRMVLQGKTAATLQVDSLESIKTEDSSPFIPTSEAKQLATSPIPSSVSSGLMVTTVAPRYPVEAKQSHIQGTVVLELVIGKDGQVSNIEVATGPIQLQRAAIETVKQWVYWPYFVNREATEVHTKTSVAFNLGSF